MEKRRLGKTKLILSEVGLGCRSLGGAVTINGKGTTLANINEETASKLVSLAIKLGINNFDTADTYSLGESERRLGKAIKDFRSNVFIFTKAGSIPSGGLHPFEKDFSYNHMISALDRSLVRLQTDYVDLFQTHGAPKKDYEVRSIKKVFKKIKKDGKAKYCGISVGSDYEAGIKIVKEKFVDAIQVSFSLLNPGASKELFSLAKKYQIGIIINRPLEEGFLVDHPEKKKFTVIDVRKKFPKKTIQKKIEFANKFTFLNHQKLQLNQLALAYVLSIKEVTSCIPSASSEKQLIDNINSTKVKLTKEEKRKIMEIQKSLNLL